MNAQKQYFFLYLIIINYFILISPQETPTVFFNPYSKASTDTYEKHGIRITNNVLKSQNHYAMYNKTYYASLSSQDFEYVFKDITDPYEILKNYPLYTFFNFVEFARTLPEYNTYILWLHNKIQNNKTFKKQTAQMPYFTYSFGWGHEKSGFHDFIADEAQKIMTDQKQRTSLIRHPVSYYAKSQDLDLLANHYDQKLEKTSQKNDFYKRLTERLDAIDKTRDNNSVCFDYSSHVTHLNINDPDIKIFQNTYGTYLDCQLHKELCQTRNTIRNLEQIYSHSTHVHALAPIIYHYTTQAKTEKSLAFAFKLSDFCHTITQILANGMHIMYDASSAVGKGVWKGVSDCMSIDHWHNMAINALQCGLLFADAIGQEDALHYALILSTATDDSEAVLSAAKKYSDQTDHQKKEINLCIQETYEKIRSMSWQDLLENGTQIGTTMILDTLALNVVNGFVSSSSNLTIKQLTYILENELLLTKQYVTEVAGFGKLLIEGGPKTSVAAEKIIKNDLALFTQSDNPISHQIKQKLLSLLPQKDILQKIRNIGDDILDIMEKAGGHTLKKHVAQTNSDLTKRIAKSPLVSDASSFINKQIATKAVRKNLKQNAEIIYLWLNNPSETQIILECSHSHITGKGFFNCKKSPFYNLTGSKIILKKDPTLELGFKIITAFPT